MRNTSSEIGRRDCPGLVIRAQDFLSTTAPRFDLVSRSRVAYDNLASDPDHSCPRGCSKRVDFMNPTGNASDRQGLCALLPAEVLPERFGGEYQPWPVQFELPKRR